jgi:hypothetical protein
MRKIICTLFFVPVFALAQEQDWFPCEVILKNGLKKRGLIQYKAWLRNPSSIVFSEQKDSVISLFPGEVEEINIEGIDIYKGATVTKYINPLSIEEITESIEEPVIEETVFLRLLSRGKILSLYAYVDNQKTHYFIEDSAGRMISLRYVKYYTDNGYTTFRERPIFRNQLKPYLHDDKKLNRLVETVRWRDDELIRIIKLINNKEEKSYAEIEIDNFRKKQKFFLGAAAAYISFRISTPDKYIDNMSFNSSFRPVVYGGYRFAGGRRATRFSFQILGGWYSYRTSGIYKWNKFTNETIIEKLMISTSNVFLGAECLIGLTKNGGINWEIGTGFNAIYPLAVSTSRSTTEMSIYGVPLIRNDFNLTKGAHIHAYGISQLHFMKRHTIRLLVSPYQTVNEFGQTDPREQMLLLGYHLNFGNQ